MKNITLENKTNDIQTIRLFSVNIPITLKPGDYIKLTAKSSEIEDYYNKLQETILNGEGSEPTSKGYDKTVYYEVDGSNIFIYSLSVNAEDMEAGQGIVIEDCSNLTSGRYPNYIVDITNYMGNEVVYEQGEGDYYEHENQTGLTKEFLDAKIEGVLASLTYKVSYSYQNNMIKIDENTGEQLYYLSVTAPEDVMQSGYGELDVYVENYTNQVLKNDLLQSFELPAFSETSTKYTVSDITSPTDVNQVILSIFDAFTLEEVIEGYDRTVYFEVAGTNILYYTLQVSAEDMGAGEGTVSESFGNMTSGQWPNYNVTLTTYEGNSYTMEQGMAGYNIVENQTGLTKEFLDAKIDAALNSVTYEINYSYTKFMINSDPNTGYMFFTMNTFAPDTVMQTGEGELSITIVNMTEDQDINSIILPSFKLGPGSERTVTMGVSDITSASDVDAFAQTIYDDLTLTPHEDIMDDQEA